jgi:hypothetical protein
MGNHESRISDRAGATHNEEDRKLINMSAMYSARRIIGSQLDLGRLSNDLLYSTYLRRRQTPRNE